MRRTTAIPPSAAASPLLPSFLRGQKQKTRVAGQVAAYKPREGLKRKKKTRGTTLLGASGE